MVLEALEFVEWRQRRVVVVEMDDEADDDLVVLDMIEERAAAGAHVERPAERVLDRAGAMLARIDLPHFLDADAVLLEVAVFGQAKLLQKQLGQGAARAFRKQRIAAAQFHAARERGFGLAFAADAHVASRNADDRAVVVVENFGRRKARIDFDAERFGAACKPAADIAERADIFAVIVEQLRHGEIRQAQRALRPKKEELVLVHFDRQRTVVVLAPIGEELVEADRVDDDA